MINIQWKEHLIVRSFITSGNKQVLIYRLTKYINNNLSITNRLKIITLLPVPRQRMVISRTTSAPREQAILVDLVWIPLKPNEENTATVQNKFTSHNPTNPLGVDISFQ